MKHLTTLLLALFVFNCSFAQSTDAVEVPIERSAAATDDDLFTIVEEMPVYPGGDEALKQYLAKETKYPEAAFAEHVEGTVFVNFVIEKDGSIGAAKVVRGVTPLLDAEALRVVQSITGFTPGKQRGKAVRVQYTIPVRFRI